MIVEVGCWDGWFATSLCIACKSGNVLFSKDKVLRKSNEGVVRRKICKLDGQSRLDNASATVLIGPGLI